MMDEMLSSGKGSASADLSRSVLVFALALAALFMLSVCAGSVQAASPVFLNVTGGQKFLAPEDQVFFMYILAQDPDAEYPLNFTDTAGSNTTNFDAFTMTNFNDTAAKVNFTPLNADVGYYDFYILARDTNDELAVVYVFFNVTNVNDAPNMTYYSPENMSDLTVKEGGSQIFNITVVDDDIIHGDYLTYNWYLNGTVNRTLLNFSEGIANFTPDYFSAGYYNISVFVNDTSNASIFLNWTVNVSNSNRVPINNDSIPNVTVVEDAVNQSVFDLEDFFYDLDTDDYPLSFGIYGNDNMSVLINATSPYNVSFIPYPNFYGINTLIFNCSDGYNVTESNEVIVNVTPVNDPPVIQQVPDQTAYADVSYTLQIQASDVDYTDTLTYYDNTSLFDINPSTGFISDTFATGEIGNYSVEIRVDDGTVNSSMVFNLSVINNSAPVLGGKPIPDVYTTEDNITRVYFNATDVDLSDTLNFWITTNKPDPEELIVTVLNSSAENGTAYFEFTPDQADVGSWTVTIYVNDTKGATDYDAIVLNVANTEHPPVLDAISDYRLKVDVSFSTTVTAADVDSNIDMFGDNTSLFNISTGGTPASALGSISFTPNSTDVGVHVVNITVNDTTSLYDWQLVTFNITLNHPPVLQPIPNQTALEDNPFQYQVVATDEDVQDTLYYYDNTTLFNISNTTGQIYFVPNVTQTGDYVINISVTDGEETVWTLMNLSIGFYNDYPYWEPPLEEYYVNTTHYKNTSIWNVSVLMPNATNMTVWNSSLFEDNFTQIYVYAQDEESGTLDFEVSFMNYTNASGDVTTSGIQLFNLTAVLGTQAYFNLTPDNDDVGVYYANFSVDDQTGRENVTVLRFEIFNVNDAPVLLNFSPEVLYFQNMTENSTMAFNVTAADHDYNSSLSYRWAVNGTNISGANTSSFNYSADFLSAGRRNITVFVVDEFNLTTMLNWTVNVSNVNRMGWFGQIRYYNYTDFYTGQGTVDRENISVLSSGGVILAPFVGGFMPTGLYESSVYDIKETNALHDFSNITWTGNLSGLPEALFGLTFQTRSVNVGSPYASCPSTISEDYNTSATYTVPESDVSSGNDRCVQFRVWMRTNDTDYTPAIDSVTIGYDIADRSQEQNTDQSWIALDYYFYEPDSDDNVTFSVTDTAGVNISEVNISIGTEVPYVVRVKAGESYTGTMQLLFHMDDGYNVTDSNVVELTIEEAATTPQVIILPVGGGGGAVSQPQPEEVPVYISTPVSFRLVVPQHVTTYMNDTMDIPINLFNSNFTMRNLRLKAVTSNPDVKLKLSQDYFDVMNPNEVKYINLRVESYKTYGTYELIVEAEADATAVAADGTESTSRFNERAKIFVNSLLKAEGNDTQVNTKLAFAEDLLSTNPECLELNEFLKKARQKLDAGEGFEADRMLEQVIESCKYLIAPRDRDALIEAPVTVYGMPTESVFILGAVALVTLIVAVALVVGWARMKAGKKEYIKR